MPRMPKFSPYGPRPRRSARLILGWVVVLLVIFGLTFYLTTRDGEPSRINTKVVVDKMRGRGGIAKGKDVQVCAVNGDDAGYSLISVACGKEKYGGRGLDGMRWGIEAEVDAIVVLCTNNTSAGPGFVAFRRIDYQRAIVCAHSSHRDVWSNSTLSMISWTLIFWDQVLLRPLHYILIRPTSPHPVLRQTKVRARLTGIWKSVGYFDAAYVRVRSCRRYLCEPTSTPLYLEFNDSLRISITKGCISAT